MPDHIRKTPIMPHVSLIVFPQFQMLAYVLATEILRVANKCTDADTFTWQTRSATNEPAVASNGAFVAPDTTAWTDETATDLVLLCAGYDPLDHVTPRVRSYLSRQDRASVTLGGVDTGTIVLAQLGLLNGYQSVLHHEAEVGFRERWPDVAVSDRIYALDGRRLTAAGGTATGDAMLAWIGQIHGTELAAAVSDGMAHGGIRNPEELQRSRKTSDPVLNAMDEVMRTHLTDPIPISDLCEVLGVSMKQLRRRCDQFYGTTTVNYYLGLRLEYAFSLLRDTYLSVTEIAIASGFESVSAFSRAFKHRFAVSPTRLRKIRSAGIMDHA